MNFIRENKKAIKFLVLFIVVYLVLNTGYGLYIQNFSPSSDSFTRIVTAQVAWFLQRIDSSVMYIPSPLTQYIPLVNEKQIVIYVFEGCNGANVMIVYISFLVAFTGPWKKLLRFVFFGIIAIHLVNLMRIGLLYGVALYFPAQLYFFHKYFFTGIIYVMVFVLWFYWIKQMKTDGSSR